MSGPVPMTLTAGPDLIEKSHGLLPLPAFLQADGAASSNKDMLNPGFDSFSPPACHDGVGIASAAATGIIAAKMVQAQQQEEQDRVGKGYGGLTISELRREHERFMAERASGINRVYPGNFVCDICDRRFSRAYHLKRHKQTIHSGQRQVDWRMKDRVRSEKKSQLDQVKALLMSKISQSTELAAENNDLMLTEHNEGPRLPSSSFTDQNTSENNTHGMVPNESPSVVQTAPVTQLIKKPRGPKVPQTIINGQKCYVCTICSKVFSRGYHLSRHYECHSKNLMMKPRQPRQPKHVGPPRKRGRPRKHPRPDDDIAICGVAAISQAEENKIANPMVPGINQSGLRQNPFDVPNDADLNKSWITNDGENTSFLDDSADPDKNSFLKTLLNKRPSMYAENPETSLQGNSNAPATGDPQSCPDIPSSAVVTPTKNAGATDNPYAKPYYKTPGGTWRLRNRYSCNVCGAQFDWKKDMKVHKREQHARRKVVKYTIENGRKVYKCKICNKGFNRSQHLSRHSKIHLNERNPIKMFNRNKIIPSMVSNGAKFSHFKINPSSVEGAETSTSMTGMKVMGPPYLGTKVLGNSQAGKLKRNYQCDICHKLYTTSTTLNAHKKKHFRVFSGAMKRRGRPPVGSVNHVIVPSVSFGESEHTLKEAAQLQDGEEEEEKEEALMEMRGEIDDIEDPDLANSSTDHNEAVASEGGLRIKIGSLFGQPRKSTDDGIHNNLKCDVSDSIKCGFCVATFSSVADLDKHAKVCPGINQEATSYSNGMMQAGASNDLLQAPLHGGGLPHLYKSPACQSTFDSEEELVRHEADCETYTCEICCLIFNTQEKLTNHMTVHNGDQTQFVDHEEGKASSMQESNLDHGHKEKIQLSTSLGEADQSWITDDGIDNNDHDSLESDTNTNGQHEAMILQLRNSTDISNTSKAMHTCPECMEPFTNLKVLVKHMQVHKVKPAKKVHECQYCGKVFQRSDKLKRHIMIHTDERPFQCEICQSYFRRSYDLNRHMLTHSAQYGSQVRHECNICGISFSNKKVLKAHYQSHHQGTVMGGAEPNNLTEFSNVMSQVTNKVNEFMSNTFLESERNSEDGNDISARINDSMNCAINGEDNDSEDVDENTSSSLTERDHEALILKLRGDIEGERSGEIVDILPDPSNKPDKYNCNECGEGFNNNKLYLKHMNKHKVKPVHQCHFCLMVFQGASHLKTHLITHTGEKPFQCDICFIKFGRKYHLNRHMRTHRGLQNIKAFKCDLCEERFSSRSKLDEHLKECCASESKNDALSMSDASVVQEGLKEKHVDEVKLPDSKKPRLETEDNEVLDSNIGIDVKDDVEPTYCNDVLNPDIGSQVMEKVNGGSTECHSIGISDSLVKC